MRVESVLGSVLECVPCARVSNQIIVYTSPNYRKKKKKKQPTQSHNMAPGVEIWHSAALT